MLKTKLLIVGAGPFGLALAAYVQRRKMDYIMVGKPMEFWKKQMPPGMFLRSSYDWHLDPNNELTMERFAAEQNQILEDIVPISLDWYLSYTDWFMRQLQPRIEPQYVTHLAQEADGFKATLADGQMIVAEQVALATGFGYFTHMPPEITDLLPSGSYAHTCDAIQLDAYRGKRILVLGGRQSAFEWAALLREAGAEAIHLSYRHNTPSFLEADWSWVSPLVDRIVDEPSWFRNLTNEEKEEYRYRLWAEGRLKVEPWLANRVMQPTTHLHARTRLSEANLQPNGDVQIVLDSGESFVVDRIILATGYKVEINRLPFLAPSLLSQVRQKDGFPILDTQFQSSVSGLYFSSFPAGNDFGPFFGFTIAVRAAAEVIGRSVNANAFTSRLTT